MNKFTHIGGFLHAIRYVDAMAENPDCPPDRRITSPVRYQGTIKLHGSNCGVRITTDENGSTILVAQSRSRVITPEDDHHGFASFVNGYDQTNSILMIENRIRKSYLLENEEDVVLYGEWIGPGIQKGVAISGLPTKQWVLFAVKVVRGEESRYIDALPWLEGEFSEHRIFSVLDALQWRNLVVDFSSQESKEAALVIIERETAGVEDKCPWANKFGIDGLGEGIVWTPIGEHYGNTDLYFKSKGDKHKEVKSGSTPALAPEVIESIEKFVDFAVTEQRLEQGLEAIQEQGHTIDMRSMGHYLKWFVQNVKRESVVELESNFLEWEQVSKVVMAKARTFFQGHVQGLSK
jgi:hypothetical protein